MWMVPTSMTSHVHAINAREGGSFWITYGALTGTGTPKAHTDRFHGRFVKLMTNEQVVESDRIGDDRFRAVPRDDDHDRAGRCRQRSDILAVHGGLPCGVPTADSEANWRLIHKTCSARRVLEKPQGA
jgi:hypothetical protein